MQAGLAAAAGMCFEFVAIFDADFMPRPDFLRTMMPHFEGRPDRALVQVGQRAGKRKQTCEADRVLLSPITFLTRKLGWQGTRSKSPIVSKDVVKESKKTESSAKVKCHNSCAW